jgi:hypothetical protein
MAVKPITGMLRRGLVLDLSVAFGMPFARARVRPSPPGGYGYTASEEDSRRAGNLSKAPEWLGAEEEEYEEECLHACNGACDGGRRVYYKPA